MPVRMSIRIVGIGVALVVWGCDCSGTGSPAQPCGPSEPCPPGFVCVDERCIPGNIDGWEDGDATADDAPAEDAPAEVVCEAGGVACGALCCDPGEECRFDVCVVPAACDGDEDCGSDTYCHEGACIPYGVGPRTDRNPECTRVVVVARFSPQLQCSWEGPPPGDAYPAQRHVLSTPMVADFDFDGDPALIRPSIVFVADDGVDGGTEQPTGVVRIISGRDCSQQFSLDMQLVCHSCPPAIGDLDGDGAPEIVAFQAGGGVVAFRYDRTAGSWSVLWRSRRADGSPYNVTGGGWSGPSIHDLDDDGVPEVLRGGIILAADGTLLGDGLGSQPDGGVYSSIGIGAFPVVADVDSDGAPELVTGAGVYRYDVALRDWVREAYSAGGLAGGHAAVADFDLDGRPEVAVVNSGSVWVHTLESAVVFGPIALPGGGRGGPPTIADFDGDGRPEIGAAGAGAYAVFDLDCRPGGGIGACPSGRTDG
ncbi:MAG: VCBS repeat-containing protein, partial [Myxococcota bacterium]|nr:VCBS repeat-containing protein [Myxococcota bacterium]